MHAGNDEHRDWVGWNGGEYMEARDRGQQRRRSWHRRRRPHEEILRRHYIQSLFRQQLFQRSRHFPQVWGSARACFKDHHEYRHSRLKVGVTLLSNLTITIIYHWTRIRTQACSDEEQQEDMGSGKGDPRVDLEGGEGEAEGRARQGFAADSGWRGKRELLNHGCNGPVHRW